MPVVGHSGDLNVLRDLRRDPWCPRPGCSRGAGFCRVWRSMRPALLRVRVPPWPCLVAGWRPFFASSARTAGADLRLFPSDACFERRPRGGSSRCWPPSTWRLRFSVVLIGWPGARLLGTSLVGFLVGLVGPVWSPPRTVWPHCLADAGRVWRSGVLAVARCSEWLARSCSPAWLWCGARCVGALLPLVAWLDREPSVGPRTPGACLAAAASTWRFGLDEHRCVLPLHGSADLVDASVAFRTRARGWTEHRPLSSPGLSYSRCDRGGLVLDSASRDRRSATCVSVCPTASIRGRVRLAWSL